MNNKSDRGFTLVEMIVAIVITGIVAAMVSFFIRIPVQSYFDTANRVELTDVADTALRRMSRDLHLALPNSIRTPSSDCFEFLSTSTGGRYRAECSGEPCPAGEDKLDFASADNSFNVLGTLSSVPAAGDRVVVYNLGIPGADAYNGDNTGMVSVATANNITLTAAKLFPFASPGNRFQVIPDSAVFYVCSGAGINASGDGTGTVYRYSHPIIPAAPSICPVIPAGTPVLATNVKDCTFTYAAGVTERSGLVSLRLSLTKNNETVSLYHEAHVSNVP